VAQVREAAAMVLREMGSILGLLRTAESRASVQASPGVAQLEEAVEDSRRAGLNLIWTVTGSPHDLPPLAELAAYRLVQEALTNARRHGTGQARLGVEWTGRGVRLEVRNPLRAASSGANALVGNGFGLVGMCERVVAAGGSMEVEQAGADLGVRAELPYLPDGSTSGRVLSAGLS
jgi:signal transduction histidine kinase